MDSKQILSVMKKMKAIVNGSQKTGLLHTGQDPLSMNDPDLVLWIQNAGIEDYEEVFDTIGLEVSASSPLLPKLVFHFSTVIP